MAHIDLEHVDMRPGPLVRYDIAQQHSQAKQLLVAAIVCAMAILVVATMFLGVMR